MCLHILDTPFNDWFDLITCLQVYSQGTIAIGLYYISPQLVKLTYLE